MIFKDKYNGREYNLNKVLDSDYWYNNHEDLFNVDQQTGYCTQVTALTALESILSRRKAEVNLCCLCQSDVLKPKAKPHDAHFGSWFKDYLDKR